MDLHDVTRNRGTLDEVLGSIQCKVCCIGFSTDVRYPVSDQQELVKYIRNAQLNIIDSIHGHDAFLIEFDALTEIISGFLDGVYQ
jgi:homoserine O-acetyltransferase